MKKVLTLLLFAALILACNSKNSSPEQTRASDSGNSVQELFSLVNQKGIEISHRFDSVLGKSSNGNPYVSLMAVQTLDNHDRLIALSVIGGCPATSCDENIYIKRFHGDELVAQNIFYLAYQKEPRYSFVHKTFFLVEHEWKEFEENEVGAMQDTGALPKKLNTCYVVFENRISDLGELDKSQVRLHRNQIFARYGYIFKNDTLTQYFSQFNWYKPEFDNVNDKLTEQDKTLVEMMQKLEAR